MRSEIVSNIFLFWVIISNTFSSFNLETLLPFITSCFSSVKGQKNINKQCANFSGCIYLFGLISKGNLSVASRKYFIEADNLINFGSSINLLSFVSMGSGKLLIENRYHHNKFFMIHCCKFNRLLQDKDFRVKKFPVVGRSVYFSTIPLLYMSLLFQAFLTVPFQL